MSRYKQIEAADGCWSDTEFPVMRGYKLACCDCGLVHEMDFDAVKVTRVNPDGSYETKPLDPSRYQVEFRVRRNARSTAMIRRHRKERSR